MVQVFSGALNSLFDPCLATVSKSAFELPREIGWRHFWAKFEAFVKCGAVENVKLRLHLFLPPGFHTKPTRFLGQNSLIC